MEGAPRSKRLKGENGPARSDAQAGTAADSSLSEDLRACLARERVVETITGLFVGTDNRDWAVVRECLADKVLLDMSSLGAGAAGTLPAQQIVDAWDEGLRPLQAMHHQAGNFLVNVDGDVAEAFCYGIASHYLPNPSGRNIRTFVGSYEFHLQRDAACGRWRIDRLRFNLKYIDGNPDLETS